MEFHNLIVICPSIIAGAEGRANSGPARGQAPDRGGLRTPDSGGFVEPWCVTNLLVLRHEVPENTGRIARKLHARSIVIGKIASKTGAGTPVFSQFTAQPGRRG